MKLCSKMAENCRSTKTNGQRWTTSLVTALLCVLICGRLDQCDANSSKSIRHPWEAPGCHLVGHTRVVKIPDCVPFQVITNACRGFCVSYAMPSPVHTVAYNPNYIITSRAECCGIVDTNDIPVQVRCVDGFKQIVFKSARSCACSICRRE